jgi:hypothetical protein
MPRRPRPCKEKRKKIPAWKSLQQNNTIENSKGKRVGVKGRVENKTGKRYKVETDTRKACRLWKPTDKGRSSCYTEESKSRKYCKRLLPIDDSSINHFPTGLYLYGVSEELNSVEKLLCKFTDPIMSTSTLYNSDDAATKQRMRDEGVIVFGPVTVYKDRTAKFQLLVKCIPIAELPVPSDYPGRNVADPARILSYTGLESYVKGPTTVHTRHNIVPSLGDFVSLRRAFQKAQRDVPVFIQKIINDWGSTEHQMGRLESLCERNSEVRSAARALAKAYFFLGMYLRKWKGPGYAYPTSTRRSTERVTMQFAKDKFAGKFVKANSRSVTISRKGRIEADQVEGGDDGGRLAGFEMAYQNSVNHPMGAGLIDKLMKSRPLSIHTELINKTFLAAFENRVEINGGGHYLRNSAQIASNPAISRMTFLSSNDSLDELMGTETSQTYCIRTEANGGSSKMCVRMGSHRILCGVINVLPYLYKTQPVWSKLDGDIASIF